MMFKLAAIFLASHIFVIVSGCSHSDVEGYYWRDFTSGPIPKDALPGGKTALGNVTYIGQVLHNNQIIPAKIDPESGKVFYEWGYKEYEATKNIKILCTQHPEDFEWVATGHLLINNLTKKNFVVAGYEEGVLQLLVGRILLGDELALGKVIHSKKQSTLNTTKDGVGTQHASFEVLCYTPKAKQEEEEEEKRKYAIIQKKFYFVLVDSSN